MDRRNTLEFRLIRGILARRPELRSDLVASPTQTLRRIRSISSEERNLLATIDPAAIRATATRTACLQTTSDGTPSAACDRASDCRARGRDRR
jgi:hypothetical protein